MPLAGIATGKVSARWLTVLGFTLFFFTYRYAAEVTTLDMTFGQSSWLRVVQMVPLPFCFISITNAAYVGMPKEQSNQVAGLINFARNIGGSILIALTNAQVTSRAMWHQQHLQSAMTPGLHCLQQQHSGPDRLLRRQFRRPTARHGHGQHLQPAQPQAQAQGYQDVYMELSWMSLCLVLLAFLLSKNKPGVIPRSAWPRALFVFDQREAHVAVAVVAEADAGETATLASVSRRLENSSEPSFAVLLRNLRPHKHGGLGQRYRPAGLFRPSTSTLRRLR
jgi:hypothetical protein